MNTEIDIAKNIARSRVAFRSGEMAAVQSMLRDGFDFTKSVNDFPSLIELTLEHCNFEIFKLMLKCNKKKFLDYLDKNHDIINRIYLKIKIPITQRRDIIKFLLDNGNNIEGRKDNAINEIIRNDDYKTFRLILDHNDKSLFKRATLLNIFFDSLTSFKSSNIANGLFNDFNENNIEKLFLKACNKNNIFVIKFLLESRMDKSIISKHNINIYYFFSHDADNHSSFLKSLIESEKNGEFITSQAAKNLSAYMAAVSASYGFLNELLDFGANPNHNNLILSVANNMVKTSKIKIKFKMIKKLIEVGANPLHVDSCNRTILHILYDRHDGDISSLIKIFDFLIQHGLDINAKDCYSNTLAHSICTSRKTFKAKFLKHIITKLNADITITDKKGRNPLIDACSIYSYQNIEDDGIIDTIIKYSKCNINEVDKNGKTALIMSLDRGCFDRAKCLLKYDIDVSIVDNSGRTAYSYFEKNCWRKGNEDICDLLDRKMIDFEPKAAGVKN